MPMYIGKIRRGNSTDVEDVIIEKRSGLVMFAALSINVMNSLACAEPDGSLRPVVSANSIR